jgi:hypothetical protein
VQELETQLHPELFIRIHRFMVRLDRHEVQRRLAGRA